MNSSFVLTESQELFIRRLLDRAHSPVIEHGREYEMGGRVIDWNFQSHQLSASIIGRDVYRVTIYWAKQEVLCGCSATQPCRHTVALCVAALRRSETAFVTSLNENKQEFFIAVHIRDEGQVEISGMTTSGESIEATKENLHHFHADHKIILENIQWRFFPESFANLRYSDFTYWLIPKLLSLHGVRYYFGKERKLCRYAGICKTAVFYRQIARHDDDDHYRTYGYRRVRFEKKEKPLDPVTGTELQAPLNIYRTEIFRPQGKDYFFLIPNRIYSTREFFLEDLARVKNEEIIRAWQHALDTTAKVGPRLLLRVFGVENESNGRVSIEGKIEFAYAHASRNFKTENPGSEISAGAKPIYSISIEESWHPRRRRNEIIQHTTGVLIRRRRSEEQKLFSSELPIQFTRGGRVRIAKKEYEIFLTEKLPALKAAGVIVQLNDNILGILEKKSASLTISGSSGIDWFEGKIEAAGIDEENLGAIIRAYRRKEELVKLKNGNWISVQGSGVADVLRSLDRLGLKSDATGKINQISHAHLMSLEAEKLTQLRTIAGAKTALTKIRKFLNTPRGQAEQPTSLNAKLRPYQLEGFNFLLDLYRAGLGGILADDMGLGKTVQAIAAMTSIHHDKRKARFLIVCPVAGLGVWEEELLRFAPGLSPYRWHGSNRLSSIARRSPVVITTFATYAQEPETLLDINWDIVFVDEAQFVKNPKTNASRELRKLHSNSIICLTGTPLENYLEDIWSLCDLIFPGYLGTAAGFRETYGGHLEVRDAENLQRKILPILLRRRKSEVLSELPEKTESIIKIPMAQEQAKVYEAARLKAIASLGQAKSSLMELLRHLMNLRRIACHPYFEAEHPDPFDSGKFEYLDSKILELAISAEGILVFSQYTSMLNVLKHLLRKRNINFLYLDGKTNESQRRDIVKRFQEGEAKFFLISLRAGGTALTLTRADTVIHLDPWWNPAVENQATDRAYRIGQKKRVIVYKLISEGTVEEKVLALQTQKLELFNELIEESSIKNSKITRGEIANLLN